MKCLSMFVLTAVMGATAPPVTAQTVPAAAPRMKVVSIKPQYLPPAELAQILGVRQVDSREVMEWRSGGETRSVEVRRNDAANLLLLLGDAADVDAAVELAHTCDVAPRQISIEAKIVEFDVDRARDAGLDWTTFDVSVAGRETWSRRGGSGPVSRFTISDLSATEQLTHFVDLLEKSGAGTIRSAPRILTLNNRSATILDGQRVTYVTRFSSFANIFTTDSMDAGLRLGVLPSIGESGYLRLDLRAELTSLTSNISGSPVKDGQIVENTVTVKDGETVLLGGFTRTVDRSEHRRFPVLGRLLPFIFSREILIHSRRESFIAITPHVVDLAAGVDERTRGVLQGGQPSEKK